MMSKYFDVSYNELQLLSINCDTETRFYTPTP
jgi:hypothetical protein